jgi:hypothetical protein
MSDTRRPVHGGLKLDAPVGVSENEHVGVIEKWKAARAWAERTHAEMLASIGDRPPPLSGQELMTFTPNEYAEVYTKRLYWYNEISKRLAGIKVALKTSECALTDLARKIRTTNRRLAVKKMTAEELKDHVGTQPYYEQIELEVTKYECLKILMDQSFDEAEQNLKAVSRQVEIRKEEFSGERRSANLPSDLHSVPNAVRRYAR